MRGAASVEFYVVALFVLIPLVMAILQLAFLYVGKTTLNHAIFMAARAAALDHGSRSVLRTHLAKGLVPLYARTSDPINRNNVAGIVAPAFAAAFLDVNNPLRTRIEILNPTRASFRDFEQRQNGVQQIPNDNLQFRPRTPGPASRQSLQEANLLKVRVDYCHQVSVSADRPGSRLHSASFRHGCVPPELLSRQSRADFRARTPAHAVRAARRSEMGALN